jgi:hypothetical protein
MLPLIAMLTMLIDHVGFIFFPKSEIYRIIGRIAFPLYSWFLVQGYLHTRDHKKYMWRLFWLACLSQVPYSLAFNHLELNVIFTLLLSLFGLYAAERIKAEGWKVLILTGIAAAAVWIPMDYGIYGIILAFIYRYLRQWAMIGAHMLLNVIFLAVDGLGYWLQLFSILGTFLIVFPPPYRYVMQRRWIYRSFYPAHLAILYLVYLWLKKP